MSWWAEMKLLFQKCPQYVLLAFCTVVSIQIHVQATFYPETRKKHCEEGFNMSYFNNEFNQNTKFNGVTYDNFCTTPDLNHVYCCLNSTLSQQFHIVDFSIGQRKSKGPIGYWDFEYSRRGGNDNARVTDNGTCVFIDQSKTVVSFTEVNLTYGLRNNTNNDKDSKTNTLKYVHYFTHENLLYSVQFPSPNASIEIDDNGYLHANVTAPDVNSRRKWSLCSCVMYEYEAKPRKKCEIEAFTSEENGNLKKKWLFDNILPKTFTVCFAVADSSYGTYGANRDCRTQTKEPQTEEPLGFLDKISQPNVKLVVALALALMVMLMIVLVLLMIVCFRARRGKDDKILPVKVQRLRTESEEQEDNPHNYEQINYDYFDGYVYPEFVSQPKETLEVVLDEMGGYNKSVESSADYSTSGEYTSSGGDSTYTNSDGYSRECGSTGAYNHLLASDMLKIGLVQDEKAACGPNLELNPPVTTVTDPSQQSGEATSSGGSNYFTGSSVSSHSPKSGEHSAISSLQCSSKISSGSTDSGNCFEDNVDDDRELVLHKGSRKHSLDNSVSVEQPLLPQKKSHLNSASDSHTTSI